MPPLGIAYKLVGFAAELDWRPLRFVKPIPGNKLCRACGLVCRKIALLPCLHLLCESCYEQCAQEGKRVCPLDEQHCQDEEVDWKETPAQEILKREVNCWNDESGCTEVMAASDICRHFLHECEYHPVFCPKCSTSVVRSDMCEHLRSDCRAPVAPLASELEGTSGFKDEAAIFSSFRRALDQQTCEMKAFLERLSADIGSRDDRLNEICHSMNALNETLVQELTALRESTRPEKTEGPVIEKTNAINASLSDLQELMRESQNTMKNELVIPTRRSTEKLVQIADAVCASTAESKERSEKIVRLSKELLCLSRLRRDHCTFFVTGLEALKEAALKTGFSEFFHEKLYLCGYCISPGVSFLREGGSVQLHTNLQLHKGEMDDSVTWPFPYKVKLSIVHPLHYKECGRVAALFPSLYLERPTEPSNPAVSNWEHVWKLDELNRDGYVSCNQLRVKWALLN